MRVALFITCFNDALFPEVGRAVTRLLQRLGHEVAFPEAQTCCGQMHFNSGYRDACIPLVERFTAAFEGFDAVVTPSPSCASMVRHYHPTVAELAVARGAGIGAAGSGIGAAGSGGGAGSGGIAGADPTLPTRVAELGPRVYELTEFLVDVLGVTDVGASFPHRVVFHPTCHSVRLLGIGDRPQRLLAEVDGLTLVPLERSDQCCGFGGTFAVKNADTSVAMGDDKVQDVLATGAEVLTAADTSCLMHIGGLLSRRGTGPRVMHLAEILAGPESSA